MWQYVCIYNLASEQKSLININRSLNSQTTSISIHNVHKKIQVWFRYVKNGNFFLFIYSKASQNYDASTLP